MGVMTRSIHPMRPDDRSDSNSRSRCSADSAFESAQRHGGEGDTRHCRMRAPRTGKAQCAHVLIQSDGPVCGAINHGPCHSRQRSARVRRAAACAPHPARGRAPPHPHPSTPAHHHGRCRGHHCAQLILSMPAAAPSDPAGAKMAVLCSWWAVRRPSRDKSIARARARHAHTSARMQRK